MADCIRNANITKHLAEKTKKSFVCFKNKIKARVPKQIEFENILNLYSNK